MATDITTIKNWFKTGLKPTQAQFWATWDSYWHKDESISISNIENLEKVLDNKADNTHEHSQYATNDATSLTDENILEWQKALKISGLKFDDKSITVTQDYSDFGLQAGATINAFNNAIYQTVRNKLDAPVEEGTTTDYPFVVGVNEDNESIKLPAGDLGKNFANTNLVVTENRKHTGSATVEFAFPFTCSSSVKYTGLLDKSSDATLNALLGLDSNGNLGKVGLLAMTNVMSKSTDAQKDAWRKAQLKTTEGYSTGQPTIDIVNPPIIAKSITYPQPIIILGSNLFINNTLNGNAIIKLIRIKDKDGNTITREEKDVTNKVSVNSTLPNMLSITDVFEDYELGYYIVKVINNSLESNSTFEFQIVENLISETIPSLSVTASDNLNDSMYLENNVIKFNVLDQIKEENKRANSGLRISGLNSLSSYINGVMLEVSVSCNTTPYATSKYFNFYLGNKGISPSPTTKGIIGFSIEAYTGQSNTIGQSSITNLTDFTSKLSTSVFILIRNGIYTLFTNNYSKIISKTYNSLNDLEIYTSLQTNVNGVGNVGIFQGQAEIVKIYKL